MVVGASMTDGGARPGERRMAERTDVSLPVLINSAGRRHVARLCNLSCTGARVETAAVLSLGTPLVLSCGTIETDATVIWGTGANFGIRFLSPVRESVVRQQLDRHEAIAGRSAGHE